MTPMETPADRHPRWAVPAIAAAIFAAVYGLHAIGQETLYRAVLESWGIGPYDFPFLDIHGELSAIQCWRLGVDVYVTNPCDALGRLFDYSPLLLWGTAFGLGTSDTGTAGLIIDGLFLLSLAALPVPRGRSGMALMLLGVLSTMVVFALERANIDPLIFALAALAGVLLTRSSSARFLAYPLIVVAALIKFYPVVLLALGLRERPRVFALIATISLAVLALFTVAYYTELRAALANVPVGKNFTDLFGAPNLPQGLATLFPALPFRPGVLRIVLYLAAASGAVAIAVSPGPRASCRRLPPAEAVFLVIGALLVAGCFLAVQNIGYRGIFLLFVLPGLWSLAQAAKDVFGRTLFRSAIGLILFLMWGEFFRHLVDNLAPAPGPFLFWLTRELAWWVVVSLLGGFLACFALESETVRNLAAALIPRKGPQAKAGRGAARPPKPKTQPGSREALP
jgi:hypothetical protein